MIAIDSMPQNRIQGLSEELKGKVSKTGDQMSGNLIINGGNTGIIMVQPDTTTPWARGIALLKSNRSTVNMEVGHYGVGEDFRHGYIGVGEAPYTTNSNLRFYQDKTQAMKPFEEVFAPITLNSQAEFDSYLDTVTSTMSNNTTYKRVINPRLAVQPVGTGGIWLLEGFKAENNYQTQEISVYNSSNTRSIKWIRKREAGVWSEWEQIVTNKPIPWINATLVNGWVGSIKYRKNALGQLEIKLYISGQNATERTICLLPIEYIPSDHIVISLINNSGGQTANRTLYIQGGSGRIILSSDTTMFTTYHAGRLVTILD